MRGEALGNAGLTHEHVLGSGVEVELDRVGLEGGGELAVLLGQDIQDSRVSLVGKGDDDRGHPGLVQGVDRVDLDGVSVVDDVDVGSTGDDGGVEEVCAELLRGRHACEGKGR